MLIERLARVSAATLALLALLGGTAQAQCPNNDPFEPNGTCATATPLSSGAYDAALTDFFEHDYYSFVVPAGGGLQLESWSDDWGAIVDLGYTLYAGSDCSGGVLESVVAGWTYANLHWENTTGVEMTVVLKVRAAFTHAGVQCVNHRRSVSSVTSQSAPGMADGLALPPPLPLPLPRSSLPSSPWLALPPAVESTRQPSTGRDVAPCSVPPTR